MHSVALEKGFLMMYLDKSSMGLLKFIKIDSRERCQNLFKRILCAFFAHSHNIECMAFVVVESSVVTSVLLLVEFLWNRQYFEK